MIAEHDIDMVRGDTLGFSITVDGDVAEMGEVTSVKMTARRATTDAVLFEVGLGSGVTATEDGWDVRVPPSATRNAAAGAYKYDVQFIVAGSLDVYTPLCGTLRIHEDQTREVS